MFFKIPYSDYTHTVQNSCMCFVNLVKDIGNQFCKDNGNQFGEDIGNQFGEDIGNQFGEGMWNCINSSIDLSHSMFTLLVLYIVI